jgi:hypothetical protein
MMLLCGFLSLICVAVGVVSYIIENKIADGYDEVVDLSVPKIKNVYEMMLDYRQVRINLDSLGISGISAGAADQAVKDIAAAMEDYEAENAEYVKIGFIPGQKELYDKVNVSWLDFKGTSEAALNSWKSGKPEELAKLNQIILEDSPKKAKVYLATVTELLAFHEAGVKNGIVRAKRISDEGDYIIEGVILAGIILGMGLGYVLASKISKSAGAVSKSLGEGASNVYHASTQIALASQSLSESATKQAASLEETVATMEEMTSMVRLNTENGQQAATLASSTRDVALKGEREINVLIESIRSIAADSKKIEEITGVIEDIAFQTNLLALNAAVEAARAGEQGKGFAVVADAVRTLAQRSAAAAKDIDDLIKKSVEKIEQGAKQANQGGVVLGEIVGSVKKVADLNTEMASASEEQKNGISQIGQAMNQLDQVTQQNAGSSEEAAASAEELAAQAKSLQLNVDDLDKLVFGKSQRVEENF